MYTYKYKAVVMETEGWEENGKLNKMKQFEIFYFLVCF